MTRLVLLLLMAVSSLFGADSRDLFAAIRDGDHPHVQKLLRAGAGVNSRDPDGTTALMHSAIESDAAMMKLLLDAGADVNASNVLNSTALMYAAVNLEKTRLLLSRGADVRVKGKGGATPMSVAVTTFGSTPVLRLLVAKGAEPDNRLMVGAAQRGDLDAIKYLLSIGVSPGEADSATVFAAIMARCDECVRLLVAKGAPVKGARLAGGGVLNETAKRAMPELSQFLLEHGASLEAKDREGFTLLMQAILSMEPPADRDRMVTWLLEKGAEPNAKNDRGDTAYLLAARMGSPSTLELLAKAGAKEAREEWPKPAGGSPDARTAVKKILPLIEMSGEAVYKSRGCVSCHNNSLPAMTVDLARKKGFAVNEEQAKKELGFAVATDTPFFEPMRLGSTIGGAATTIGYTLMGMAAAGYPADAETDSHVHYLSISQSPDGSWKLTAYRPPAEYSPFTTTAVVLRAIRLYPIPGRREEFKERFARAKKWLLATKATSEEERSMQLLGLADAGATVAERVPFVKALKNSQNTDGSWSLLPGYPGEAYATGEALYALHIGGEVSTNDPVYAKGAEWLLRNQLADGSWFMPTRAVPVQPHTFESGFPHGWHQFASDSASSWASIALLFTLPDAPRAKAEPSPSRMPNAQQNALVHKYCAVCHTDGARNGGLSLEHYDAAKRDPALAAMLLSKLRNGAMGAAGLGIPDKMTADEWVAATVAQSEGARKWTVSRTGARESQFLTASIVREVAPRKPANDPPVYRLSLSCNVANRHGEMQLAWSPEPQTDRAFSVIADSQAPIPHNVQGKESMGNGTATTSGQAAFLLNAPLPHTTLTIQDLFPSETVIFPLSELDPQTRRDLATCFPAGVQR